MRHDSGNGPLLWILLILVAGIGMAVYDIDFLTYAILGIGILLLAGAVFVIVYSGYWVARNHLSAATRAQARVVRRRKKDWDVGLVGDTPESSVARLGLLGRQRDEAWKAYSRQMAKGEVSEIELVADTNYFVTFNVDGCEKEFCVPEDYYIKCNEDTQGLLVYRGEGFMHFIADVK